MTRRWRLLIAGLLLLAGAAAWLVLAPEQAADAPPVAVAEDQPAEVVAGAPTSAEAIETGRVHVTPHDADEVADELPPPGAIRVVESDGSLAMAAIYVTHDPVWSLDGRRWVGGTGPDGVLLAEDRDLDGGLGGFIWAISSGRIAGPERFDALGHTLTLGPGTEIEMHVRRPDGTPVTGALCDADDWRTQAVTDADGVAVLSGFPAGGTVQVRARVLRSNGRAVANVELPADGSDCQVEIEIVPGAGPFVLVAVTGDVAPDDEVRIDVTGGQSSPAHVELRGDDPPLLVSVKDRGEAVVTLSARALGTRPATDTVEGLESGTTERVELELVVGGTPQRGRVLNADGTPAVRAEVGTVNNVLRWGSEVTDEGGWFDVQTEWLGEPILAMRDREACSPVITLQGDSDELVLHLGEGATLHGIVRDETSGQPVEGAQIRVAFGISQSDREWYAESDAGGAYSVSGIPPGTFVLPRIEDSPKASPVTGTSFHGWPRGTALEKRLLREGLAHRIVDRETVRHDLAATANAGGECTFRVVFPPGVDLPERYKVEQSFTAPRRSRESEWHETTKEGTRENMQFTVFLEEGTHRLRVTARGLSGAAPELVVSGEGPPSGIEIHVRERRTVIGQLVDASGKPFAREDVSIRVAVTGVGGGRSVGSARTGAAGVANLTDEVPAAAKVDADGAFVVFTLDGEGLYAASPWGKEANLRVPGRAWAQRLRAATSEPWWIKIPVVKAPRVTVRVLDAEKKPAAGVQLRWKRSFNSDWTEGVSDSEGVVSITLSDEYDELEIEATGGWIGGREFQRMSARTSETTLSVDRRRTVRVRFTDPAGNALADLPVICFVPGVWTETVTDEHGFVETDVPLSETTFEVRSRGHWPPADVAAPAGATQVDAVIEPLFAVTFEVLLPPELARPEAVDVRIGTGRKPHGEWERIDVEPDVPLRTSADLPRRPFAVSVDVHNRFFGGTAQYTGVEDVVVIRVERVPLRSVVLVVTDMSGAVVAGERLHVFAHGKRDELDEYVETDAQGRFTLELRPVALPAIAIEADDRRGAQWDFDPDLVHEGPIPIGLGPPP